MVSTLKIDRTLQVHVDHCTVNAISVSGHYLFWKLENCCYLIEEIAVVSSRNFKSRYWQFEIDEANWIKRGMYAMINEPYLIDVPLGFYNTVEPYKPNI